MRALGPKSRTRPTIHRVKLKTMKKSIPILVVATLFAWLSPVQAENPVKNVRPQEAAKLLEEKKGLQTVDVRTSQEFTDGHIAGAKNLNFLDEGFKEAVAKLDASKPVLVYCQSGGRSSRSLMVFRELGFKEIYHLDEGFMSWEDAGLEVEE